MESTKSAIDLHQLMSTKGRLVKRAKGQIIQTSDAQKNLNLVKSGFVKRYLIKNDGTLGVDLLYGPRDIFSLTLIFKMMYGREILDSPEVYYYEAMTETELYTIDIYELAKQVEKNPLLYRDFFSEAGKRMTSETHGLENITIKNSYKRVAHQLVYYAKRFGKKTSTGFKILPPLTHQDIADILSLTRETVSVCMMRLRKKKLIKTGSSIVVPNLQKLTEEAFD